MMSEAAPSELVYLQKGVVLRTLLQGELYIYKSEKITIQKLWLLVKYDGIVKRMKKRAKKKENVIAWQHHSWLMACSHGEHKSFLPQGPCKPGLGGKAGQSPDTMGAPLFTRVSSPGERIGVTRHPPVSIRGCCAAGLLHASPGLGHPLWETWLNLLKWGQSLIFHVLQFHLGIYLVTLAASPTEREDTLSLLEHGSKKGAEHLSPP